MTLHLIEDEAEAPEPRTIQSEAELEQLVHDYMPLVRHAVNRVAGGAVHSTMLAYEDLLSCGVQGLIEAYKVFDAGRGAKFSTFAMHRIRGSILDALRAAHPLPRSLQKASSDIDKAQSALYAQLGRSPTREELAGHLGMTVFELAEAMRAVSVRVVSLDGLAETAVDGATEKLAEMADLDPSSDPEGMAEDESLRGRLLEAIERLPARERHIVELYYIKSRSLKSIGQELAISESRASQLRHRAIRRLRAVLVDGLAAAA